MSSKQEKALLAQLTAMMQQQQALANTPDPNISRLMGLNNAILDWHTNANNTVKDIYKHPLLGDKMPVFQMAKSNMDKGRIGRGIVGRTDINNAGYAQDVASQDDVDRSIAASGMLEQGLQNESDQAQTNLYNLAGLDTQRKQGYFSGANATSMSTLNYLKDLRGQGWGAFFRGFASGL